MNSINLATLMLTLLRNQGGGSVNTAVPELSTATPVIGTAITITPGTWTGSPTLTYQWQRNTGSWADISGATNDTYTPVDADFGYALRVVETANGVTSANSAATANLTREAPAQSLGAELLSNPGMDWSGGSLTGFTLSAGTVGGDPGISEVAAGGGAGTGAVKFTSTASKDSPKLSEAVLTSGEWYEIYINMSARTASGGRYRMGGASSLGQNLNVAAEQVEVLRAVGTSLEFRGVAAPLDFTIDAMSAKLLTRNAEITVPSADMNMTQLYTLPGTPKCGQNILFMLRISSDPLGNYWLILLQRVVTQWDMYLYSVASHTRTSRTSAGNIGTTNGIQVNMNGDSISMFTTADGGDNWTQRGSTVTNSLYNTATGVNVMSASEITLGSLIYAPAA